MCHIGSSNVRVNFVDVQEAKQQFLTAVQRQTYISLDAGLRIKCLPAVFWGAEVGDCVVDVTSPANKAGGDPRAIIHRLRNFFLLMS